MPAPYTASVYTEAMSPLSLKDFSLTLTQGDGENDLIMSNETVDSCTVTPSADAAANGLTILDDGGEHVTVWDDIDLNLYFWPRIDPARADDRFAGDGMVLELDCAIVTSVGRTFNFALALQVQQGVG